MQDDATWLSEGPVMFGATTALSVISPYRSRVKIAELLATINLASYREGVLYLPAMVEIQPAQPDWGVVDSPALQQAIDYNRPHGGDEDGGKLLCLLCMQKRAREGGPVAPVWMYLQIRQGRRLFCHLGSHEVHPEHEPESDEHKALVEREVRTCELVGASVDTEVRTAGGRRRADFMAVSPTVTLAGEVQLSQRSAGSIAQRQRDLTKNGNRALWTTDSTKPGFLNGVPRLVIPNLTSWQQALEDPELAIVAGMTLVEYQPCGWADQWSGSIRCPETGLMRPCGKLHAYPTANVSPNTYRPMSGPAAQVPTGNRPHLDVLVAGIVTEQWLPYERKALNGRRRQFVWMPAEDYHRFVEERGGGDPGVAERSPEIGSGVGEAAARTCETGTDKAAVNAVPATAVSTSTVIDLKPRLPKQRVILDWSRHKSGELLPCRYCRKPASMRDEQGIPAHKLCAEDAAAADRS